MNSEQLNSSRSYLFTFDQILNEMVLKMTANEMIDNITTNFIQCMIPHHQAAIYMCQNLLQYTNNQSLKELAIQIINMQTRGIQQMKQILASDSKFTNTAIDTNFYNSNFFHITTNMISKMASSLRSVDINLDFITEMIPHHEGAVLMCQNLLNYSIDPRLKAVAQSIIKQQSRGIEQLKMIRNSLETM